MTDATTPEQPTRFHVDGRDFANAEGVIRYLVAEHTKAELIDLLMATLHREREAQARPAVASDHDCLMPSACGVTGFYCSNADRPAVASEGLRPDPYQQLRDEFPQRPDSNSLDRWRKALPPDFPLYNAHGDYIGRLTELHHDADHLSCLGCGQIGTPSTFNATTGIYLCAERCVPALRAALAASVPAPLDVDALYTEFVVWDENAARDGSGMTQEQRTGGLMFKRWLQARLVADPVAGEGVREGGWDEASQSYVGGPVASEGLRAALERGSRRWHGLSEDPQHMDAIWSECPNEYCMADRAALASDAGSVGALDVERLARALRSGPFAGYTEQRMLDLAQIIAAAYAAAGEGES